MASVSRVATLAGVAVVVAGCSSDPHRLSLVVRAADAETASHIAWIGVRILEGGCDGTAVYTEGFRPTETAAAPPRLGPGTYGFEARAHDAGCNQIAFVCNALALPRDGTIELVMTSAPAGPACASAMCDGGACLSACDGGACPPACDGGVCPPACDGGACPGGCGVYPESACPTCEPDTWSIEVADPSPSRGADPSATTDSEGGLHATWQDTGANTVMYAYHPPDGYWADATIDAEGDVGMHADVDVDAEGGVHVAYHRDGTDDVLYAYKAPGSETWARAMIDAEGQLEGSVSIAVDPEGTVHVLYRDAGAAELRYARSTATGFAPEAIAAPDLERFFFADMDVDAAGTPHVMVWGRSGLRYASRSADGTWSFEEVTPPGTSDAGFGVRVAVEPDGRVHAVFHASVDRGLGYAQRTPDGAWSTYVVSPDSEIRMSLALDVGPAGDVHVTYQDDETDTLRYVRRDPSGGWTPPADVSSATDDSRFQSVAADAAGGVHVAFSDDRDRDLRYAYLAPGGVWESATIATRGNVGAHASIAVDDNGLVHVVHQEETQRDLLVTCGFPRGFWRVEPIADGGVLPGAQHSAIAVGPDGDIHVVYRVGFGGLHAAHRATGGDWTMETVDSSPSAGTFVTMAIAPSGALHAAYVAGENALRHATRDPTGAWSIEGVAPERADSTAIAVGPDGVVHLAFHSLETDEVRYGRRSPMGWLLSSLYPNDAHRRVGLAVDGSGGVHAVFADEADYALRYAYLPPGAPLDAWMAPAIVDAEAEAGEYLALAVDSEGRPHVAFSRGTAIVDGTTGERTGTSYDLRYATTAAAGFEVEVIETSGDIGQHVAIALEPERVHVVFPDPFRRVHHAFRALSTPD